MNAQSTRHILTEGLTAGAIGYAVNVFFFAVLNVLTGRGLFHTPALLGSFLFYDSAAPASGIAGPVIAFNGVAVVAMLLFGMLAAWLAAEADRGPVFLYLAAFGLMLVLLPVLAISLVVAGRFGSELPQSTVLSGAAVAIAATVMFVYREHPLLRGELQQDCEDAASPVT
jgi:hypothetical protein